MTTKVQRQGVKVKKSVAVAAPRCNSPGVEPAASLSKPVLPAWDGTIKFRPYQLPVFQDHTTRVVILHWSRQIGKSFTLAAWAIDRILTRPGRLITVLSNSRDNGAEFLRKCEEVCRKLEAVIEWQDTTDTLTPDELQITTLRMEARITVCGAEGRIKVLAANPRTARGFSGDLILDEFAFHENSEAIWEAAEPILSSNPDFLCRIASTGNGKHNMFYRMSTALAPDGKPLYKVIRVRRSDAWRMGVKIYDPSCSGPITPEEARERALNKQAYDQNYECTFENEESCLISSDMISAVEQNDVGYVCVKDWTPIALARLAVCQNFYLGVDVARTRDFTVISAVESIGEMYFLRAILRILNMPTPQQQDRLDQVLSLPAFRQCNIDCTGIGLGLFEYAVRDHGALRITGVNFATTVPITKEIAREGRPQARVKVTEAMAMHTAQIFADRRILVPTGDQIWRDDMRKPSRITSPGGSVSVNATREGGPGHADHFWSLALALDAAMKPPGSWTQEDVDAVIIPGRNTTLKRPTL